MNELNPTLYIWLASLGAFLVGLSKGGLPAVGMLSVPILSLAMPPMKAAMMLLPIYVVSDMVGIWLYRHEFSVTNLRILVPAGILGVAIGWATASWMPEHVITFLIGLMGVAFCLNAWLRKNQVSQAEPADPMKGRFWGAVSGFTSFISHAGAPPFQIYVLPQKLRKTEYAGTATLFFALSNWVKIVPYHAIRPYTLEGLWSAAFLVPAALVGTVTGAYLTRKIDDQWFFRIVQLGLLGVSLKLMADSLGFY